MQAAVLDALNARGIAPHDSRIERAISTPPRRDARQTLVGFGEIDQTAAVDGGIRVHIDRVQVIPPEPTPSRAPTPPPTSSALAAFLDERVRSRR